MPAGLHFFSIASASSWFLNLYERASLLRAERSGLVRMMLRTPWSRTHMLGETSFRMSIETVRKLHALAERRRRHYVELYRSERWRRYFTEEAFLLLMRDAIQNTETWAKILEGMTGTRESAKAA
jgi:hypothetical protein